MVIREAQSQAKTSAFRRAARGRFEAAETQSPISATRKFVSSPASHTPGSQTTLTLSNVSAITLGQGLVAGASILGLGSWAYYGLGFGNAAGIIDKSAQWPQLVRDRVKSTYTYLGASLGATALSAMAILRSPTLMNLAMRNTIAVRVSFSDTSQPYGFNSEKKRSFLGFTGHSGPRNRQWNAG